MWKVDILVDSALPLVHGHLVPLVEEAKKRTSNGHGVLSVTLSESSVEKSVQFFVQPRDGCPEGAGASAARTVALAGVVLDGDECSQLCRQSCEEGYVAQVINDLGASDVPFLVLVLVPERPACRGTDDRLRTLGGVLLRVPQVTAVEYYTSEEAVAQRIAAAGLRLASANHAQGDWGRLKLDGGRKCEASDFHAVYLAMLGEVHAMSSRRAAAVVGVATTMNDLLGGIDAGRHPNLLRGAGLAEEDHRVGGGATQKLHDALTTDYHSPTARREMEALASESRGTFASGS